MNRLIGRLREQCDEGCASMLVTIVGENGSSPRSTGASMAVGSEGRLAGTIGGGMLEFKAIETAKEWIVCKKSGLIQYRLNKNEVADLGMICGGDVDVLFTFVASSKEMSKVLSDIEERIKAHTTVRLILSLDGKIGFCEEDGRVYGIDVKHETCPDIKNDGITEIVGQKYFIQKLKNNSRVYIFGGGHLAQELVPLLSHLDFRCVVTDDRQEYSRKELFPDAEEVHTIAYDNLEGKLDVQPQDYVVAVTRGHMGDFDVQCFALKTNAYYIGVVGSRSKIADVNLRLKKIGFTEKDISRITAPIGISIKSETPAEIAVSIAAQLIEFRANYKK